MCLTRLSLIWLWVPWACQASGHHSHQLDSNTTHIRSSVPYGCSTGQISPPELHFSPSIVLHNLDFVCTLYIGHHNFLTKLKTTLMRQCWSSIPPSCRMGHTFYALHAFHTCFTFHIFYSFYTILHFFTFQALLDPGTPRYALTVSKNLPNV